MGDDKNHTIQIKGTAYRFKPMAEADVVRFAVVANMGASHTKTIKAMMRVLGNAAGADQWDVLTDRLIDGEIDVKDLTAAFSKLIKKQTKDSATETPDDDAE